MGEGRQTIVVRPGDAAGYALRGLCVGRGSALALVVAGVPSDVTALRVHVGRPGKEGAESAAACSPLPDGRWSAYLSGLHFPDEGTVEYHVTGLNGRGDSVWLGSGRIRVRPSVLHGAEGDEPLVPEDAYVRNPETGLWHKLTVSIEDGVLVPEISNEGVTR